MFKKIKSISNFAVFDNYSWDSSTLGREGSPLSFSKINIIYGQNYSGKTSLSRIIRSFETKLLPDRYIDASYTLVDSDGSEYTQDDIKRFSTPVRVFNEDFVKDNLYFLSNPEGEIAPFAILGNNNGELDKIITQLTSEIGNDGNDGKPKTGLNLEVSIARGKYDEYERDYSQAVWELDSILSKKATDKKSGIKYNPNRFGDVNYNITKLKADIKEILLPEYVELTEKQISDYESIISDQVRSKIEEYSFKINYAQLRKSAETLLRKRIGVSNKIQRLINDAVLNDWVKKGVQIADNARQCPFCGHDINSDFWAEIHAHFDEESKELDSDIISLITLIESEIDLLSFSESYTENEFYSEYVESFGKIRKNIINQLNVYKSVLQEMIDLLRVRQSSITVPIYDELTDYSTEAIFSAIKELNELIANNNAYANHLAGLKAEAQSKLRLKEVSDFCNIIDYSSKIHTIDCLQEKLTKAKDNLQISVDNLAAKCTLLDSKKRLLHDEEKGALLVNELLNNYFGHRFISLEAHTDDSDGKHIKFIIMRDGHPAFNLSEGECSLIAFCYFIAKLDDINTSDTKPIIWIDDPISSLDSNHIYFVFSLIVSKIAKTGHFDQLFISTHNLDFLKYLHRITSFGEDGKKLTRSYFMVERTGNHSVIKKLPRYLWQNATEYNYLFSQIYRVSECSSVSDENYDLLYSFGNSARKFLELYLYFKYPTNDDLLVKLKKFFAPDDIPAILINRLLNEDSHGPSPENSIRPNIDPETIPVAKKIISLLQMDEEQFKAFTNSIE